MLSWLFLSLGCLLGCFLGLIGYFGYFLGVLVWGDRKTRGLQYYGRTRASRAAFRRWLGLHRFLLGPMLWGLSRTQGFRFDQASFELEGLCGPKGTCSEESFRRGLAYEPRDEDVFVASQMKSGTTWLQQVVVQVLTRGDKRFDETGEALYALAPWLESDKSVSLDAAPEIGLQRPSRVIKTHFPASHCPYSAGAKYIYVTRHPVSCFASCVDFVSSNLGGFAPPLEQFEAWYCSDSMWWGDQPTHVESWQAWAQRSNVLIVNFESMKQDLRAVVEQVAKHLGMEPLTEAEMGAVLEHSSFEYMQAHADCFEMNPPHLLQFSGGFLFSGKQDRFRDTPPEVAERIKAWCAARLRAVGQHQEGVASESERVVPQKTSQPAPVAATAGLAERSSSSPQAMP